MSNDWITAYKDDDLHLELSIDEGIHCIHTKVLTKLTPKKVKTLREVFKEICLYLDAMGVASLFAVTPNPKFARLVTGNTFDYVSDVEGQKFIVWNLEEYLWH